jgi:hypothetical protein
MAWSKARRLADLMSTSAGIPTASIQDDAITSAKIADDAVVSAAIADDAVVSAAIADDAVVSAAIADDAVVSAAIADDAVTSALVADDAVVQAAIADEAVDEARIQISNAGSNGQFLSKQSGNTGGLTWADASGWSATTEGLVTTSAGDNDIEFSIPAGGVNRIQALYYDLDPVDTNCEWEINVHNGTSYKVDGYLNYSTYVWTGSNDVLGNILTGSTGIMFQGWSGVDNLWFGTLDMSSINDGKSWHYTMDGYNYHASYRQYWYKAWGIFDLQPNVLRKLKFLTTTSGGFAASSKMRVYYTTMG